LRQLVGDKPLDRRQALDHLGAQIGDDLLRQRIVQFAIATHLIALGGQHFAERFAPSFKQNIGGRPGWRRQEFL
jgi:hypothetical protein